MGCTAAAAAATRRRRRRRRSARRRGLVLRVNTAGFHVGMIPFGSNVPGYPVLLSEKWNPADWQIGACIRAVELPAAVRYPRGCGFSYGGMLSEEIPRGSSRRISIGAVCNQRADNKPIRFIKIYIYRRNIYVVYIPLFIPLSFRFARRCTRSESIRIYYSSTATGTAIIIRYFSFLIIYPPLPPGVVLLQLLFISVIISNYLSVTTITI